MADQEDDRKIAIREAKSSAKEAKGLERDADKADAEAAAARDKANAAAEKTHETAAKMEVAETAHAALGPDDDDEEAVDRFNAAVDEHQEALDEHEALDGEAKDAERDAAAARLDADSAKQMAEMHAAHAEILKASPEEARRQLAEKEKQSIKEANDAAVATELAKRDHEAAKEISDDKPNDEDAAAATQEADDAWDVAIAENRIASERADFWEDVADTANRRGAWRTAKLRRVLINIVRFVQERDADGRFGHGDGESKKEPSKEAKQAQKELAEERAKQQEKDRVASEKESKKCLAKADKLQDTADKLQEKADPKIDKYNELQEKADKIAEEPAIVDYEEREANDPEETGEPPTDEEQDAYNEASERLEAANKEASDAEEEAGEAQEKARHVQALADYNQIHGEVHAEHAEILKLPEREALTAIAAKERLAKEHLEDAEKDRWALPRLDDDEDEDEDAATHRQEVYGKRRNAEIESELWGELLKKAQARGTAKHPGDRFRAFLRDVVRFIQERDAHGRFGSGDGSGSSSSGDDTKDAKPSGLKVTGSEAFKADVDNVVTRMGPGTAAFLTKNPVEITEGNSPGGAGTYVVEDKAIFTQDGAAFAADARWSKDNGLKKVGPDAETLLPPALNENSYRQKTLTHELGHHIQFADQQFDPEIVAHWEKSKDPAVWAPSKYARTRHEEWFAEAHTAYVYYPAELQRRDPAAFAFVKKVRQRHGIE